MSIDDDEILNSIKNLLGTLTPQQQNQASDAIRENAEQTLKLAQSIAANPKVNSPAAVFLSSIKRGDHRKRDKTAKPQQHEPLDKAHTLFRGKLATLPTAWLETERVECAIDYALDWCGASGTALFELEDTLRRELGAPRWQPSDGAMPRDQSSDTEHRRQMRDLFGKPTTKEHAGWQK